MWSLYIIHPLTFKDFPRFLISCKFYHSRLYFVNPKQVFFLGSARNSSKIVTFSNIFFDSSFHLRKAPLYFTTVAWNIYGNQCMSAVSKIFISSNFLGLIFNTYLPFRTQIVWEMRISILVVGLWPEKSNITLYAFWMQADFVVNSQAILFKMAH